MSAFQLPALHIAAIIGTAYRQTRRSSPTDMEQLVAFASVMAQENFRSVSYRYNDEDGEADAPSAAQIQLFMDRPLTLAEAFMALNSFEYQSCECPDWKSTQAYALCVEARDKLSRQIPGYDECKTWCLNMTPAELEAAKRADVRKSMARAS